MEVTPPGFATVTFALPAAAIRLAGTAAVNWLELTYVVDNGTPFHSTTALERKPDPFTASIKGGPPAMAKGGRRPEILGADIATLIVTGTLSGLLTAPAEAIAIEPLYAPGANPAAFTETVRAAPVVPLAGLTDSQLPPLVVAAAAVKDNAEPVELAMVSICEGGWLPPCW